MRALIVYNEVSLQLTLAHQLQQRGYTVLCCTPAELSHLLQTQFADIDDCDDYIVIDCASRELDSANQPVLAEDLFQQLIAHCAQRCWSFLLLSDSRAFPAGGKQRYREIDRPQPTSAAGQVLARREHQLATGWSHFVIVRSGPLIASAGNNLLTDMLGRLRAGGTQLFANTMRFCPTPAEDLARVISAICDQLSCAAQCWGIYHYHSSDATSDYEFAEVVCALATQYWDLQGVSVVLQTAIDDSSGGLFPLLNCQHIRDTFGIQQLPWRKAIPQLLKTIYAGEAS